MDEKEVEKEEEEEEREKKHGQWGKNDNQY